MSAPSASRTRCSTMSISAPGLAGIAHRPADRRRAHPEGAPFAGRRGEAHPRLEPAVGPQPLARGVEEAGDVPAVGREGGDGQHAAAHRHRVGRVLRVAPRPRVDRPGGGVQRRAVEFVVPRQMVAGHGRRQRGRARRGSRRGRARRGEADGERGEGEERGAAGGGSGVARERLAGRGISSGNLRRPPRPRGPSAPRARASPARGRPCRRRARGPGAPRPRRCRRRS